MATHDFLGRACALGAAVSWAFALVLFKRSGERVKPVALNLFKNTVGIALLAATVWLFEPEAAGQHRESKDVAILAASGVIGIAVADTLFFASLNLIGVGLVAIADCTYSPFVTLFSWALLGEQLTGWHYAGGALIVAGVGLASRIAPPAQRTRAQIIIGMMGAAASMGTMAFGIVLAKPVLERFPLAWATSIRLAAGTAALALMTLAARDRGAIWAVFRPASVWKVSIPAAVLGTYVSLLLWVGGFKYTSASIAGILNQTSVIFALVLATLMLKEPFGRRKLVAVTLALAGVAVTLAG